MRKHRAAPRRLTGAAPRGAPSTFTRTLERQIEEIMSQAVPQRQLDGARRGVVSVLFVTVSEFVGRCEDTDPGEMGSALDIYLETVADSVGKFLGTVQGSLGDLVMATWNASYPQPDHAVLAVNAALDLVERTEDVRHRLRAGLLPEIGWAMGVNTGDALIRAAGTARRGSDVVGDTVNVAQLLSQAADESCILIGEGTEVSVGEQIRTRPAAITTLPGKRNPVQVFEVTGRVDRW